MRLEEPDPLLEKFLLFTKGFTLGVSFGDDECGSREKWGAGEVGGDDGSVELVQGRNDASVKQGWSGRKRDETHDSLEHDVETNGCDEGTDPRFTSFGLLSQAFSGNVLVVEDHRLGNVAVSKAGRKDARAISGEPRTSSGTRKAHWIMAGRPKQAPDCLSQQ